MEIHEEIVHHELEQRCADPYRASIELMARCASLGHIAVQTNRLLSSGPRQRAEVTFWIERKLDAWSKLMVFVSCTGEQQLSRLTISMIARFDTDLPTTGCWANELYASYYMTKLWPRLRQIAERLSTDTLHVITCHATASVV